MKLGIALVTVIGFGVTLLMLYICLFDRPPHRSDINKFNFAAYPNKKFDLAAGQNFNYDLAADYDETFSSNDSIKRIAIIGAGGYVGSKIMQYLLALPPESGIFVRGFDREPLKFDRGIEYPITSWTSSQIPTRLLRRFQHVVYLGGLTGRQACLSHSAEVVYSENVEDILNLAHRMHSGQTLIFASTSAVAEGSGQHLFSETSVVDTSLLDVYSNSLFLRENALRSHSQTSPDSPRMIGLRFGTVVGSAPCQRTDLILMSLVRNAFLSGVMPVQNPDTYRALLWTGDLASAVHKIIIADDKNTKESTGKFSIFNLQSFDASIAKLANHVAWRTGALPRFSSSSASSSSIGFSLNSSLFKKQFNFSFVADVNHVVEELIHDRHSIMVGRTPRNSDPAKTAACVICGSHHLVDVLDLGHQPLANEFHASHNHSLNCSRHPLKLVTCPHCLHSQLSHIVPRAEVFEHYLYQSGTSNSLKSHFEWLADKVTSEMTDLTPPYSVLEIACNDGTQLDSFLKRGWNTFGVDPAKNLIGLARSKGHEIISGFWGHDTYKQVPGNLSAIVAQNVLAHTDNPVDFMLYCAKVMGPLTRLYVQTSQCQMYENGQFDTIYHEHISFFTAHSFRELAARSGLTIVNFEMVPIHGSSCLVTLQRQDRLLNDGSSSDLLNLAMSAERSMGLHEKWFYVKYEHRIQQMRKWMVDLLNSLHGKKFRLVGYGAAAKAIVMLHFLISSSDYKAKFEFILDDAPLKQNTYCPGTDIPVKNINHLVGEFQDGAPVVIVIFAWNFFDEVVKRLANFIKKKFIDHAGKQFFILRPFPEQILYRFFPSRPLDMRLENIVENVNHPVPLDSRLLGSPNNNRKKVAMITHFYNEEFLLPQFIRHHSSMFDKVILINQQSTDKSERIIASEAPPSWIVVPSTSETFSADQIDAQIMGLEQTVFKDNWKVALTVTEFLVHPNLREHLDKLDNYMPSQSIFMINDLWMVGNDESVYNPHMSLPRQRSRYSLGSTSVYSGREYSRRMHKHEDLVYTTGRHSTSKDGSIFPGQAYLEHGMIMKFKYTPWPGIVARKLQIGSRIPDEHIAKGWGTQHQLDKPNLDLARDQEMQNRVIDLADIPSSDEHEQIKSFHKIWEHAVSDGPALINNVT